MFTRSSTTPPKPAAADARPLEAIRGVGESRPLPPLGGSGLGSAGVTPMPAPTPTISSTQSMPGLSIIGNDLTIMGQGLRIVSRGTLQVDGRIEGDVVGAEVVIGEKGHVTGVVAGEKVVVRGAVLGTIRSVSVAIASGARVEGDVHHHQLTVEQGAHLDGRVRHPADIAELKPDLSPAAPIATAVAAE